MNFTQQYVKDALSIFCDHICLHLHFKHYPAENHTPNDKCIRTCERFRIDDQNVVENMRTAV